MHSGLHAGGLPMKPGTQEHTACPLISRHWLFGPQGDGLHGCVTTGAILRDGEMNVNNYAKHEMCWYKKEGTLKCQGHVVHTWDGTAYNKWISRHSLRTAAYGDVIHYITYGSLTTSAGTRICTSVPDTSSVSWTVSTQDTFRSTPSIGVSLVFWQTTADSIAALSIWTTGWWIAGIWFNW